MHRGLIPSLLLLLLSGAGCDECSVDLVEATMPATVQGDSGTRAIVLGGAVTEANISFDWPLVVAVAIRGTSIDTVNALVWALTVLGSDTSGPAQGGLAVIIPVPVTAGDSIPVDSLDRYSGLGVLNLPTPFAAAAFTRGSFRATTVSGFFRILQNRPLRLHLDLDFANQAGNHWLVKGDMSFRMRTEPGCT